MARTTTATLMDEMRAELAALREEIAAGRVRKTKVTDAPRTFATHAEMAAGGGFLCTAEPPCGHHTRTPKRASIHGVDLGGHEPR